MGMFALSLLISAMITSAQAAFSDRSGEESMLPTNYDQMFPYYIKYCATSRWSPKENIPWGVKTGHSIVYIKGVRLIDDPSVPERLQNAGVTALSKIYQKRLELYPEQEDLSDVEKGVGLSVDSGLENTNFFLIPSYSLFFSGGVATSELFTREKQDLMVKKLAGSGIIDNIVLEKKVHPKDRRDLNDQEEKLFVADYAFGTDYAISMSRDSYCINLPLNRKMMGRVVEYVNLLSDKLQGGKGAPYRGTFIRGRKWDDRYHWGALYDNCATTTHNIFSELGVVTKSPVNETLIKQIFGFALPSNSFLSIHYQLNIKDIDVDKIYNKRKLREALLDYDWLPISYGTFLEKINFHSANSVYNLNHNMVMKPHLVLSKYKNAGSRRLEKMLEEDIYTYSNNGYQGMRPHLDNYLKRYSKSLEILQHRVRSSFYLDKELLSKSEIDANTPPLKAIKIEEARQYIKFVKKFEQLLRQKINESARLRE